MTLSFYPPYTRQIFSLVLVASVVFVILQFRRRPESIKWLLAAITIIGGVTAVVAQIQVLLGTKTIYGQVLLGPNRKATGGPFVNDNNYGHIFTYPCALLWGYGWFYDKRKSHTTNRGEQRPETYGRAKNCAAKWLFV